MTRPRKTAMFHKGLSCRKKMRLFFFLLSYITFQRQFPFASLLPVTLSPLHLSPSSTPSPVLVSLTPLAAAILPPTLLQDTPASSDVKNISNYMKDKGIIIFIIFLEYIYILHYICIKMLASKGNTL